MLSSDSGLSPLLARAREWAPAALLILALATLFVFGGDRGYFNRSWVHNENSAKNLALAENLSPVDNFRLFTAKRLAEDGSQSYDMYSRFPIGGTALIKLAIAPFDTLSAKLAAGRTLALLMFCGAAVFAYLAIARLASSRWIGLAAALIAFSSYYALYYSNEVSNESAMDIFGVMLTFHGMVVFVQDGRFRQLLIKACAALLVGWHVYALLLAFIVFGLARETVARLRGRSDCSDYQTAWNIRENRGAGRKFNISIFAALIRSRYMVLGAATLAFGIIVLGANLVNEYYAYGGETPPTELQSFRSAFLRANVMETEGWENLNWSFFARLQMRWAGRAALPYALAWKRGFHDIWNLSPVDVAVGILAVGGALAGVALARRHRALWATLALFGFFWAIPMRGNTVLPAHDFEAMHYVGVPLALFGTALMGARRLWGERAPVAAALAAVIVFAVSAFQIQTRELPGDADRQTMKAEMADFAVIREKTRGEVVEVENHYTIHNRRSQYYLAVAGSVLTETDAAPPDRVKYVIRRRDDERGPSLTPRNRVAFLYEFEPSRLPPAEVRRVESANEPAARSDFDLYLDGGRLYYVKERCSEIDARGRFFLSVHPVNLADLPEDRREIGHDAFNFDFSPRGIAFDGKCAIRRQLPYYPIAAVLTGQYIPDEGEIWSAEIKLSMSAETVAYYDEIYQAAKSGEPLIESDFDVYLNGDTLTYLKAPCGEDDTRGRFLLSVHPVHAADLPEDRREIGHASLNFDFAPSGIIFGDKCMISRELPDYTVSRIATGQWIPGGDRLWTGEAAVGGGEERRERSEE